MRLTGVQRMKSAGREMFATPWRWEHCLRSESSLVFESEGVAEGLEESESESSELGNAEATPERSPMVLLPRAPRRGVPVRGLVLTRARRTRYLGEPTLAAVDCYGLSR